MTLATETDAAAAFDWLDDRAAFRERAGLSRSLRPLSFDSSLLDVAGNDYLGLARHPVVCEAAARASERWGAGATASRLVTGSTELHGELEEELARFCGTEAAIVFSSGYTANLGAVTALCGADTLLVADRHNHASLVDGCRLAGGSYVTVGHNDIDEIDRILTTRSQGRALVVVESVFSVDGDLAPLPELLRMSRRQGAGLIVDDAHGLGVIGQGGVGAVAAGGLTGEPDVVTTITLSKALGAQGGAVLGPRRVIRHLVDSARSFIYDTGLAPAAAAGALAALRVLQEEPERAERVRFVARALADGLGVAGLAVAPSTGAIISLRAPSAAAASAWAGACRQRGVAVGCFRPPSVPDRVSRLRLTAHANLTDEAITRIVDVISECSPRANPDEK